jgi:hypothetical protein
MRSYLPSAQAQPFPQLPWAETTVARLTFLSFGKPILAVALPTPMEPFMAISLAQGSHPPALASRVLGSKECSITSS